MNFMYYRLKDLREDKDLNQEEVGKVINTSACYYGAYENGKRDLPLQRAIELAEFYEVSLDYLAGMSNDKGGNHCNFLDSREKELIQNWRKISVKQQNRILDEIEDYLEEPPRTTARKSVI